jgi:hypothetical protein
MDRDIDPEARGLTAPAAVNPRLCREQWGCGYLLRVSGRSGEQGHGSFGELAAFAGLPFVVGFDQDRAGQTEQDVGVGEDADDVGVALDFLVQPLQRVR